MAAHALMIRLDDADRLRLETEARQLGMSASALVAVLLHATLAAPARDPAAQPAGCLHSTAWPNFVHTSLPSMRLVA